ncbi:GPW/gp25 family protein [Candidatus Sulfopaludibacter sp. SbA3]|nr:GPW/gp25 family protein [Candidatus Sulfopaludibacter sp. SbA3]
MNIAFPFQIDGHGRTATTPDDGHIRDMIEQLLFTNPGERVNRPSFGSGLLQMVFEPSSTELAAALQFTLQASLQQLLGSLIQLQTVQVAANDGVLQVTVQYIVRGDQQTQSAKFSQEI